MRRLLRLGSLGLLAISCATTAGPSAEGASEARAVAALDFTLRDIEGRDVRLSEYAGQVVLVDFWATWCVPCEAAMPHLQSLYEKHRAQGFAVLAVSMDGPETILSVAPFARRHGLTFPVLLDEETIVTGQLNPKRTAPLSLLLDRDGRVVHVRQGYSPGDEIQLAAEVERLLSP